MQVSVLFNRSPNATANQARPKSIYITLSAPLSGSPEQTDSPKSESPQSTTSPTPIPQIPSASPPDKQTDDTTHPSSKSNGSYFLSLTAGFAHGHNDINLKPVTYKPHFVHRPTTLEPDPPQQDVNNRTSASTRNPPFSLSNLPTAEKKSVTFQLSARLLTQPVPTQKTSESLQQLPSSDVRSTENPNKREIAFNRNSYLNSLHLTNSSNQNIVPTTYAPSRVFLAMLLPKHSNLANDTTDKTSQSALNDQDNRKIISSQEFEEKSKNLFKRPNSYKENHEKPAKNIKPIYESTTFASRDFTSTESNNEKSSRKVISRIHFGFPHTTNKNVGAEKKNVFLNSEEYFNTARKATTTSERITPLKQVFDSRPYLPKNTYLNTATVSPSTERVSQFKFTYNPGPTTTVRSIFVTLTSPNVTHTTKTFIHQIGHEDITTVPTKYVPTTTPTSITSSIKSDYFQTLDENVRRTTENARYVSPRSSFEFIQKSKQTNNFGRTTDKSKDIIYKESNRFNPTTEYYSTSTEQHYEPQTSTITYDRQPNRQAIISSNGFKYINKDYYQSRSTTTESLTKTTKFVTDNNTFNQSEVNDNNRRYINTKSSYLLNSEEQKPYRSYRDRFTSTESISENSSEDVSTSASVELSSTTENDYKPRYDSKTFFENSKYKQNVMYTTTTIRPRATVPSTTAQIPVTSTGAQETKPRCTSLQCELLPNRNTKPFRATVEIPTVPEILASIEEKPSKFETDNPPTYKLKPIQKPDLTNSTVLDNSRNTSIPARLSRVNTAIKSLIAIGGTRRNVPKCNEKQSAPNAKCNEIQNQRYRYYYLDIF